MTVVPTNLERENLEAHVDLCAQRYNQLELRLTTLEAKVDAISRSLQENKESLNKVIITAAGSTVASIIGIIITILLKF